MNIYTKKNYFIEKIKIVLPDLHEDFKLRECLFNKPFEYEHEIFNIGSFGKNEVYKLNRKFP